MGILPVIVFDGPYRPNRKRGVTISTHDHHLESEFKKLVDAFGFEWRKAPGEAEAELALMSKQGLVDAVLTDDADTLLFGAKVVIRNWSPNLSGSAAGASRRAAENVDQEPDPSSAEEEKSSHVDIYHSSVISNVISLDPHDHILVGTSLIAHSPAHHKAHYLAGLMSGGDYNPAGIPQCGPKIAIELAKAGFGKELVAAVQTKTGPDLDEFLREWVEKIKVQLSTNPDGHLSRKRPALAKKIPPTFPDLDVVRRYTSPATSAVERYATYAKVHTWANPPNIARLVDLVTLLFEWTHKEIHQKFRNVLFQGLAFSSMRRYVLCLDEGELPSPILSLEAGVSHQADHRPSKSSGGQNTIKTHFTTSKPPKPSSQSALTSHFTSSKLTGSSSSRKRSPVATSDLPTPFATSIKGRPVHPQLTVCGIHSTRQHASTGKYLEYRVEVVPTSWAQTIRDSLTIPDPNVGKAQERKRREALELQRQGKEPPPPPTGPPRQRHYDDPVSSLRFWIPAEMLGMVCPLAVEGFHAKRADKDREKREVAERKEARAKAAKAKATSTGAVRERLQPENSIVDWINRAPARKPKPPAAEVVDLGSDGENVFRDNNTYNRKPGSRRRENLSSDSSTVASPARPTTKSSRHTRGHSDPRSKPSLRGFLTGNYHDDDDELPAPASLLVRGYRGNQQAHSTKRSGTAAGRTELSRGSSATEVIDLTCSP
jgi:Holliday junction resolvase YEN1